MVVDARTTPQQNHLPAHPEGLFGVHPNRVAGAGDPGDFRVGEPEAAHLLPEVALGHVTPARAMNSAYAGGIAWLSSFAVIQSIPIAADHDASEPGNIPGQAPRFPCGCP